MMVPQSQPPEAMLYTQIINFSTGGSTTTVFVPLGLFNVHVTLGFFGPGFNTARAVLLICAATLYWLRHTMMLCPLERAVR